MTLGIMQAYFFPYFGYFQLIHAADVFRLYEHVSFRKRSWMTRNYITNKGTGKPIFIKLPIRKSSSYKAINDILVDNSSDWQAVILNLLYYNYKKAPYFEKTFTMVEDLLRSPVAKLHDFNTQSIRTICEVLDIETEIISAHDLTTEQNLKKTVEYSKASVRTERILGLCSQTGADQYINPPGGRSLYKQEDFATRGVELRFIYPGSLAYAQYSKPDTQTLSIIDVLMHVETAELKLALNNYQLTDRLE